MNITRLSIATFLSVLLLSQAAFADVAQPQVPARQSPEYSQRYTVQVGTQHLPMLKRFERGAKDLDKNRDGFISNKELGKLAEDLPGDLRVDVPDYTLGLAHQFTGTVSSYRDAYPSAKEIENQLEAVVKKHPESAKLVRLGTTPEGRPLQALRLRSADLPSETPRLAIIAGQHAREWIAPEVALRTIEALTDDPDNADLLANFEFWIVALANPDGYEFSRNVNPMWRKNRYRDPDSNNMGIDLNRNFPFFFRKESDAKDDTKDDWGASDHPASEQYRGPSASSEPETQALEALLAKSEMAGVIDLHGFGCKVILPNEGHRIDDAVYRQVSKDMLKALGPDYKVIRYSDLYPITGTLTDYADHLNIVGITLEIGTSFQPRPTKIVEFTNDGTRGVLAFARAVKKAYQTAKPLTSRPR